MIALGADCLLFRFESGESVPYSAAMVSVEVTGEAGKWLQPELVQQAAKAVFHYFKHELGREMVTVGEFSEAMEKALGGFREGAVGVRPGATAGVKESDLNDLARDAGEGGELVFYARLRAEVRLHLSGKPRVLRFHVLRGCVKRLAGARRWTLECRQLEDEIVSYLRSCASAEKAPGEFALVVE
jgi:hypothetical protein